MGAHVTILGLGNIGSALSDLLARLPEIGRLTLVDRDRYTPENLASQCIARSEIGVPKAIARARRLRRLRPDLKIDAHHAALEDLPVGQYRVDLLCACLDSRLARMNVNEIAWRLGVPWIDAGVRGGEERLARVDVYIPGPGAPCLECAFTDRHYASLEIRQPCQKADPVAPTNAPAYLGALAAALQAAEVERLLQGALPSRPSGWQVLVDGRTGQSLVSQNRRNPVCRFDHRIFAPEGAR